MEATGYASCNWGTHNGEAGTRRSDHDSGVAFGITTGFKNLDHHLGGFVPGRMYAILGRPGDTKSFSLAKFATEGMLEGRRVGMFSPEMNEFEHRCRVHTLLSADPKIQEAVGIRGAFRNRALMGAFYLFGL